MLYPIYKAVEAELKKIPELKDVQWYNAQYEGTIHTHPVAFVEFPDEVDIDHVSKSLEEGFVRIRVHVASKVIGRMDTAVPDIAIQQNEDIATEVKGHLKGLVPVWGAQVATRLKWVGWQHYHRWKGWMVTFVSFECKVKE